MHSVIICEGKTDAILLSYFLIKLYGWKHAKKHLLKLSSNEAIDRENEIINWYINSEKPERGLVIWGVGGISQVPTKLSSVIDRTINEREENKRFDRIAIYFDRDTKSLDECHTLTETWCHDCGIGLPDDYCINMWTDISVELAMTPRESHTIQIMYVVIPPNEPGNLESFLIKAIRDSSDDGSTLVDRADDFIAHLPDEPYLLRQRLRGKAWLGTILSVMSPDWVFSTIDERLHQIEWEDLINEQEIYLRLQDL
jgi:hypothetical protein